MSVPAKLEVENVPKQFDAQKIQYSDALLEVERCADPELQKICARRLH
jgi:hypothetical protein